MTIPQIQIEPLPAGTIFANPFLPSKNPYPTCSGGGIVLEFETGKL
jgi:hypothetical protein